MVPLNTVEKDSFKNMVKTLDLSYVLRDQKYSSSIVDTRYVHGTQGVITDQAGYCPPLFYNGKSVVESYNRAISEPNHSLFYDATLIKYEIFTAF